MKIKRPLLLLTGGFVLGEVLILQRSVVMELLPAAALAAFCCVLICAVWTARTGGQQGFSLRGKFWKGRSLWLWLLPFFVCAGMLRAQQVKTVCEQELLLGLDGKAVQVCGTVRETAQKDAWAVFVLEDCAVAGAGGMESISGTGAGTAGILERLQVYVDGAKVEHLPRIGNQVCVRGECMAFEEARNPGEFDYRQYYRSLKLNYRMFAVSLEVVDASRDGYRDSLARIAEWAFGRLGLLADEDDAGIFRAVLLGDKSTLPENIRDMYQKNGIAHLLAVSGLHLSLVSLAVYGIFRRLGAGFGTAGLAGGAVLFSYALLSGASPSVMRALIMVLCGFLAAYLGRTYDLLSALCLAVLCLLWDSPYLLFQAGVQLSFGAIVGIGGAAVCLTERTDSGPQGKNSGGTVNQGFLLSVSMQMVTLPLILFHFFQYPLYGIFLNLLVVPLMGVVLASGAAGIALAGISLGAGRFAIGSGCAVLGWYEWCCGIFERLPGSNMILGRPELWQIGIYYGLLAVAVWLMNAKQQKSGRYLVPVMCLLFAVLLPLPVHGLEVTFLDVGQGDGICLRTGQAVVLVDGGSSDQKKLGESRLEPFLKSRGIRTVDYWLVSHGDQDHVSGLIWLMEESGDIAVKNLILPAAGYGDESYERLEQLAKGRGSKVSWMEPEDYLQAGELKLTCLYPEADSMQASADRNDHSLVLRTDYGEFHMLLTGDMSGEGERRLLEILRSGQQDGSLTDNMRNIQVLKVAHHGSRFSTTGEWLDVIQPEWAVVSYGEGNRYGHPHAETMERLENHDVRVYETGESGAVILRTDGKRIWWSTWLGEAANAEKQ